MQFSSEKGLSQPLSWKKYLKAYAWQPGAGQAILAPCWAYVGLFLRWFLTPQAKKTVNYRSFSRGGVDTGWVGGRGRSAYNLRLPPKASGKDTGSVAGARIKGLPLPAANPWVTRESWSKWLNTTVLGPLHDSKTLASQHRKTMELKDGRGLSTDSWPVPNVAFWRK